jgi:hypothetical protein
LTGAIAPAKNAVTRTMTDMPACFIQFLVKKPFTRS